MKYLIIKCEELMDAYECDANRIPVCITEDICKYQEYGFEIYDNGNIGKCIKDYDINNMPTELVVFKFLNNEEDYENNSDIQILESVSINTNKKEEIVKMKEFKKFVNKYLHREYKFAKHDFLHNGCCESIDHTNLNNCIVISTKQGKYIDRGY